MTTDADQTGAKTEEVARAAAMAAVLEPVPPRPAAEKPGWVRAAGRAGDPKSLY